MAMMTPRRARRDLEELRKRVRVLEIQLQVLDDLARLPAVPEPVGTRPDGRPALRVLSGGAR